MTYKTGTIHDFMSWTKQMVQDPEAVQNVTKQWFDGSETATQSRAHSVMSLEPRSPV